MCSGTLRTRAGRGRAGSGAGLTVAEGVQVAKDAEAIVGPLGGHGQLPQGCADLCRETRGGSLPGRGKREVKRLVCSGLAGGQEGGRRAGGLPLPLASLSGWPATGHSPAAVRGGLLGKLYCQGQPWGGDKGTLRALEGGPQGKGKEQKHGKVRKTEAGCGRERQERGRRAAGEEALTCGYRGKWRSLRSCCMELPHQSSNTCRLTRPRNCTGQGQAVSMRWGRPAAPARALLTVEGHGPRQSRSRPRHPRLPGEPHPRGLALRPGAVFLSLHVSTRPHACIRTYTHSRLFPCRKWAGLHPPGRESNSQDRMAGGRCQAGASAGPALPPLPPRKRTPAQLSG